MALNYNTALTIKFFEFIMIVVSRNALKAFRQATFQVALAKLNCNLILRDTHFNGKGQIFTKICRKIKDFVAKQDCFA